MTKCVVLLLLALQALTMTVATSETDCGPGFDYDALRANRVQAIVDWIDRVNHDFATYNLTHYKHVVEDFLFTIRRYGTYDSRLLAIEYGMVVFPESGFDIGKLTNYLDETSFEWLSENRLSYYYENIQYSKNVTTGKYYLTLEGMRNREVTEFVECSDKMMSTYVVQDPDSEKRGADVFKTKTLADVCGLVYYSCYARGLMPYSSIMDCVAYLSSLPPTKCPFPNTGNTAECRNFHALNALADPVVHCPHTARDSVMCTESCLEYCGTCDPNAKCAEAFINITVPNYECRCNVGYVGDGHSCEPVECTERSHCPGDYISSACLKNDSAFAGPGICGCQESFTWNSTTGECHCDEDKKLTWKDGKPTCMPIGRCLDRYDCPQDYNKVKCVKPVNIYATSWPCRCNYGFEGGFENDCTCRNGKSVVWSPYHEGKICVADGECTQFWHCDVNQTCSFDPLAQKIGTCV